MMSDLLSSQGRSKAVWRLRSRVLDLGVKTRIMGIVNITPDSFSDGGLYLDPDRAIEHALQLLDEGADLIDLGAESTRPGSNAGRMSDRVSGRAQHAHSQLSSDEEQDRLLPVIQGVLKGRADTLISVDTYKSQTAFAAINAGAQIVNDVSGFTWDADMARTCAELRCGVVLTHTRGTPGEWKKQAPLTHADVLPLVLAGLADSLVAARSAGIIDNAVVLDPGYGFGKRFDENYALLARQSELLKLGRPLLAGVSRKSFLTRNVVNESAFVDAGKASEEARETASIAGLVTAILQGASIVRVHQVRAAVEAAAVADAVLAAHMTG